MTSLLQQIGNFLPSMWYTATTIILITPQYAWFHSNFCSEWWCHIKQTTCSVSAFVLSISKYNFGNEKHKCWFTRPTCAMHAFSSVFCVYYAIHDGPVTSTCDWHCQSMVVITVSIPSRQCGHMASCPQAMQSANDDNNHMISQQKYWQYDMICL